MKTHALLDNQLTEALFWLVACYSWARCLVCGEGRPCPACWVSTEATPCWGAATGTIPAQAMACSLPSGLTARLPGVTWAWQVVLVDCGGGGQGRVPTGDCASVPAARAGQPWRLQPALRPPLPPLLATTRAAPPAAATLATQHVHTTTSRMNLHPPAQGHGASTLPLPPPATMDCSSTVNTARLLRCIQCYSL